MNDIRRRMRKGGLSLTLGTGVGLPVAYLLNDSFTNDVAAGGFVGAALNAVPGPGTRTVVDPDNKIALSGGLAILTGQGGTTKPFLYWDGRARQTGLMLISETLTTTLVTNLIIPIVAYGGDPAVSYAPYSGIVIDDNLNAKARYSTYTVIFFTPLTANTYYKLAVVLKSSGAYYFIKGGTQFTNWTLAYIESVLNTTPVYPFLLGYTNAKEQKFTFAKTPTLLWTPKPISADDFGGTHPTLDNAVSTLTGLEAYTGATRIWGEYLSGTGTTGAGVSWDHEWEFAAGSLADTGSVGGLTLTEAGTAPHATNTTDWAGRADHAKLFDGNDYYKVVAGSNLGSLGDTFTIVIDFNTASTGDMLAICGDYGAVNTYSWYAFVNASTVFFRISNGVGVSDVASSVIELGKHNQAIIVNNNKSCTIYINGVKSGSGTLTTTMQDGSAFNFCIGSDDSGDAILANGSKISRVATLKGTALTAAQVKAEYEKWVACDEANTYARMYGGPDPGAAGLSKASGTLTQGTWGTENADEFSYQAYAIRYNTAAGNPGDFDNSTNLLRRTGTWANTLGYAVNTPVAGSELLSNTGFETAGAGGADVFANWTEIVSGTSTVNDEAVVVHGGSHACRFDMDATGSAAEVLQNVLTAGRWTRLTGWFKVDDATGSPSLKWDNVTVFVNIPLTTSYVQNTCVIKSASSSCSIKRNTNTASKKLYLDDVSAKPLTLNQLLQLTPHTGTPDVYCEAELSVVASGFQAGIALNWDSPTNPQNGVLIYLNRNDDKVYVDRCVAGVWTNEMAGVAAVYAAGAKLVVRKIGSAANNLYVWYNNIYVGVCTSNTVNPSTTDVIHHGIFATGASATETKLDLWRCYPSGSNSEYALLDMFIN